MKQNRLVYLPKVWGFGVWVLMKCGAFLLNVSAALWYLASSEINSKGSKIKREWLGLGFSKPHKENKKVRGPVVSWSVFLRRCVTIRLEGIQRSRSAQSIFFPSSPFGSFVRIIRGFYLKYSSLSWRHLASYRNCWGRHTVRCLLLSPIFLALERQWNSHWLLLLGKRYHPLWLPKKVPAHRDITQVKPK